MKKSSCVSKGTAQAKKGMKPMVDKKVMYSKKAKK